MVCVIDTQLEDVRGVWDIQLSRKPFLDQSSRDTAALSLGHNFQLSLMAIVRMRTHLCTELHARACTSRTGQGTG